MKSLLSVLDFDPAMVFPMLKSENKVFQWNPEHFSYIHDTKIAKIGQLEVQNN